MYLLVALYFEIHCSFYLVSGCARACMEVPGLFWVVLGCFECSWLLLGCFCLFFGAPRCFKVLLGAPGRSWAVLGWSWALQVGFKALLGAPGRSRVFLGCPYIVFVCFLALPSSARCFWVRLGLPGRSRVLLGCFCSLFVAFGAPGGFLGASSLLLQAFVVGSQSGAEQIAEADHFEISWLISKWLWKSRILVFHWFYNVFGDYFEISGLISKCRLWRPGGQYKKQRKNKQKQRQQTNKNNF